MDSPACPFGLPVVFVEGDKKTKIDLGTDECGLIRCHDRYYRLNIELGEVEKMQDVIRSLGIDFDRIRY